MFDYVAPLSSGLAFFIVAVTPGPANISNATIAMSHGRKISLVYGTGLSCGLVFWGLIAASGMGAVLQSSIYVLMTLKILGGLYLLWLAYQSAGAAQQADNAAYKVTAGRTWFLRGLILNISNPKSVMAWLAALSVGLKPDDGLMSLAAATTVCIVVGFTNNTLYSLIFSLPGMMRSYQRFRRWILGVSAVLFALAGFGLIRSAFSR